MLLFSLALLYIVKILYLLKNSILSVEAFQRFRGASFFLSLSAKTKTFLSKFKGPLNVFFLLSIFFIIFSVLILFYLSFVQHSLPYKIFCMEQPIYHLHQKLLILNILYSPKISFDSNGQWRSHFLSFQLDNIVLQTLLN